MQLHEIKPKTKRKTKKTVGRGGKRGKTSGRGTKGQKARAGHRIRPAIRDVIKKLPKRRGEGVSRNRFSTPALNFAVINLNELNSVFTAGESVNPQTLLAKGLLKRNGNNIPKVKILGGGALDKNLEVRGCTFSKSAETAIAKAGGTVR